MNNKLIELGFSERAIQEASSYHQLFPGRVITHYQGLYKVATTSGEIFAEVSGRIKFNAAGSADFPVTGDFVMVDRDNSSTGNAIIHHILNRKSIFERKAAGTAQDTQVVAVNIDFIFICMALNSDFNLRRLERYLSIGWASGALPVVLLTKSDLSENLESQIAEVKDVAAGADLLVASSLTGDGLNAIRSYLSKGKTAAFIGSSGVGKSTLINKLMGEDIINTAGIRKDGKGKHTTSRRELFFIPSGGAVIDTPGMRELGVETADIGKTFADIEGLSAGCRFNDCSHTVEPGCAVKKAVENGEITAKRLENYLKLKKEARYDGLDSKQIEKAKIDEMFSGFGGIKNARDFVKNKNKRPR